MGFTAFYPSYRAFGYVGGNPVSRSDSKGLFWDLLDIAFFLQSLHEYSECSSGENALNLGLDAVGLLPGIPALGTLRRVDDGLDAAKKLLKDGDALPTNEALDAALQHLGEGYTEIAPGVFKSADGTKIVRMTDSDLAKTNNHANAPHMNFETGETVIKPNGKETFISNQNNHIFLPEE